MTLKEIVLQATEILKKGNIVNSKHDAESLIKKFLGLSSVDLVLRADSEIPKEKAKEIFDKVRLRCAHIPLQYIVGDVDFCNVTLEVTRDVLIPRPETEELVDFLISYLKGEHHYNKSFSILDLGTGSGAIAISLAKEFPESQVLGVDLSLSALKIAKRNAERNQISNVRFIHSDWFKNIPHGMQFDVIAANPPYLTWDEWNSAESEVKDFEPISALVAENEGLQDIEKIIQSSKVFLKKKSILAIETGILHGKVLLKQYAEDFKQVEVRRDLSGRDRFFIAYNDR